MCLRRNLGGGLAGGIRWTPFLELKAQILHDGTVTGVVLVASSIKTDHALALLIFESFLPASEMVIEGLGGEGLVRAFAIANGGICRGCATGDGLAVFPNWALPWVLVVIRALVHNCLEGGLSKEKKLY
jgi:hypothetical protein